MHIIVVIANSRQIATVKVIAKKVLLSRRTVVYHAAQEAGAPHREYINTNNRKEKNAVFTPM